MQTHTTPLHLLSRKREILVVNRWYEVGEFCLHPTIEYKGWTVTHTRSHMAVIQKIRTRGQAAKLVAELALLTDKWSHITDQKSMTRQLTHRERGAVLNLINQVRNSREWSFP